MFNRQTRWLGKSERPQGRRQRGSTSPLSLLSSPRSLGGCPLLAIDSDDFLPSFTSFGEYSNAGTKYVKEGRNERKTQAIRPMHYGFRCSNFARVLGNSNQSKNNLHPSMTHILRSKGLNHGWMGPHVVPTQTSGL